MNRYSSNYCSKGNNYIIDIFYESKKIKEESIYSSLCVIKNILQRGNPTKPSQYLLETIGDYNKNLDLRYISQESCYWDTSIKGNIKNNDNPALYFYKEILEKELGEFSFITNLLLPEAEINEITEEENYEYLNNAVDFYLPQAKLVIEIDGSQHMGKVHSIKDKERDNYLKAFNINTVRIPTKEINDYRQGNDKAIKEKLNDIYNYCNESKELRNYGDIINNSSYYEENKTEIIYDTILRFQMLIIELLMNGLINIDDKSWEFNIKDDGFKVPYEIAVKDVEYWLKDILNLQGIKYKEKITTINNVSCFSDNNTGISIDISLFKRWDDYLAENLCVVRADHFDGRNYFKVATSELIEYKIKIEGEDSNVESLYNLNKNIFGFDGFNNGQLPIIINALSKEDTLGLLPTGGGKSLCYQLCCMLQPTINYVVVPIKSLMYDQKLNLDKKGIVHSNYISGDQEGIEKEKILNELAEGKYFYVWISPERFQTEAFRQQLRNINLHSNLGYAIIDEVHCLSEWGHDFRTSYLNLAKTIKNLSPGVVFLGLTATASKNVLKDILIEFEMEDKNVKTIIDYTRPELIFKVIQDNDGKKEDKYNNLVELITTKNISENVLESDGENSKCGLVFTPHVNGNYGCYGLVTKLQEIPLFKGKVRYYSGEVPKIKKQAILDEKSFNEYKRNVQDDFQNNKFPLLFATKAFGMGVDKPNVRYTIHYGISGSIESFYQEAGRAGRDKKDAICYVLHSKDDINEADYSKIFALDTTVEELNYLLDKYKYPSGDVLRNLFLALGSNKELREEYKLAYEIYLKFCSLGKEIITVRDVYNLNITLDGRRIDCTFATIQKAIYRLSLLGIINDWTIEDWGGKGKFRVVLGDTSDNSVEESLNNYIQKYDVEFNIKNLTENRYLKYINILKKPKLSMVSKCLGILIQWNYDNVFYARRQSQKNLVDLCDQYFEKGEKYFKEVLEGYFRITDNSYVLDYLVSNPYDISAMYQILFDDENLLKNTELLRDVNLALTRFLESFRYNTALNYLSGILALILDEYKDLTKLERLESAFQAISERDDEYKNIILDNTLRIGKVLNIQAKDNLSNILCNYYDKEIIYKTLEDNVSLNFILEEVSDRLEKVGGIING